MGASNSSVATLQPAQNRNIGGIDQELKSSSIVVYSISNCGFCTKAKTLLNQRNLPFAEFDLKLMPDATKRKTELIKKTGLERLTVPQIFVCGKWIGGFDELSKMLPTKEFMDLLSECSTTTDT